MNKQYGVVLERLEAIVAELECEFLYLLNDMYVNDDERTGQVRLMVASLRVMRDFLSTTAVDAQPALALAGAK